jgi:tetratricopeptide (TPR) repeat protein
MDTARWNKFDQELKKLARLRSKDASHRARFLRAQRAHLRGRHKRALRDIKWVAERHPAWLDVHVTWAKLLLYSGQELRARKILDRLPELFEAGKIQSNRDKVELARALSLLGFPREAHELLRELVLADPGDWRAHLEWASLLKAKHNPEEAHKEFEQVLRLWPDHPAATVGLAELLFERANQVHAARKLLLRLKLTYGPLRSVRLLEARMALFQESFSSAESLAKLMVAENPKDREGWTVLGALAFLRRDQSALNTIAARVERIHPNDAEFWHQLGVVASRFHRYGRAVDFHRHALRLDPGYTEALVDLGIAHSRLGDDTRARIFLNKAREADPFDKRAYYMTVQLFDGALKNYDRWEHEGILYRLSRGEAPALKAILPAWLRVGRERYRKRYDVKLSTPMNVEIFEDPRTFSIRAVGTTHFWAHGVCFGRVLAMRSPNAEDFNAREVLLHELSHAYHLQMTAGRVPRWFTEGLAELDTMGIDPSLSREIYGPMSERLAAKEMVPICALNRSFEQASSKAGLLAAYMQSRLVLEWLEAERGGAGIRAMLQQFGLGSDVATALRTVHGLSCAGADKRFLSWARMRLADYLAPKVYLPLRLPPTATLKKRFKVGDVRSGALLAWSRAKAGDVDRAQDLLEDARISQHPIGRWLSVWLAWKDTWACRLRCSRHRFSMKMEIRTWP